MSNYPKLTHYVSEIDQFLRAFDMEHTTPSLSQQKEIEKYRRVYFLRNEAFRPEVPKTLWDKF